MERLGLLFTSSNELTVLNKKWNSNWLNNVSVRLKSLEELGDTTLVTAIKQYYRTFLILYICNLKNKDSSRNKLRLCQSVSVLFSLKPLIRKFVGRLSSNPKTIEFWSNLLILHAAFVKYPSALMYQRNYISVYLSIVSFEFLVEKFTDIKNFWLLFPFTFAKIWEYYLLNKEISPKLIVRSLDFLIGDVSQINFIEKIPAKLSIFTMIAPAILLKQYWVSRDLQLAKPVLQSISMGVISLSVVFTAKLLTLSKTIPVLNKKHRLQLIGLISSLPSIVYYRSSGLWLYLTRLMILSINKKHTANITSKANKFKIDKFFIISSLLVLLTHQNDALLKKRRAISKLLSFIDNGKSLVL